MHVIAHADDVGDQAHRFWFRGPVDVCPRPGEMALIRKKGGCEFGYRNVAGALYGPVDSFSIKESQRNFVGLAIATIV